MFFKLCYLKLIEIVLRYSLLLSYTSILLNSSSSFRLDYLESLSFLLSTVQITLWQVWSCCEEYYRKPYPNL